MPTITVNTTAGDCWGSPYPEFYDAGDNIAVGNDASSSNSLKAWVPFVVSLPRFTVVTAATLKVVSYNAQSGTTVNVKWGCEAADNPAAPTTWDTLNARVMSAAYLTGVLPAWADAEICTFDVKDAVQETLNRAGWVLGNTLAVLFFDNGSDLIAYRNFYSAEGSGTDLAKLEIEYTIGGNPVAITPYMMF